MTYDDIKNIFSSLKNQEMKMETLIDFGNMLLKIPEKAKCIDVLGCSSKVEVCKYSNIFYGQADSKIVSGVLFIILTIINDSTTSTEQDIKKKIFDLDIELTFGRLTGIDSIIKIISNL